MRENRDKKIEKWAEEIEALSLIRVNLEKFIALKEEKGEKDAIDRLNAKIANIIEDNSWTRLEWSQIKRGKQSRQDGLDKIDRKIRDRQKKIEAQKEALGIGDAAEDAVDWEKVRETLAEGSSLYHWCYGEMKVMAMEDDYIYLKIMDKRGVRSGWPDKNKAAVSVDGKVDEVKEFPMSAVGRWLFPEAKDALDAMPEKTADEEEKEPVRPHKMFEKL